MRVPFATQCLIDVAPHIGASIIPEPEYGFVGQIIFENGKTSLFKDTFMDVNTCGASRIVRDKGYTAYFLEKMGYAVPRTKTFFSKELNENIKVKRGIAEAYEFAQQLGFPIVIKPNEESMGKGVTKVSNKTDFYHFAAAIFEYAHVLLVQEFCHGRDYRVVVLGDQVHCAYERIPLTIVGDGVASILDLLLSKQQYLKATGRNTRIDIEDERIKNILKYNELSLTTILPKGRQLKVLNNANLSNGGEAVDWTKRIHPDFEQLAINITKDMGLRLCGVDIMTADISKPPTNYHIIELNSAPGLNNYAALGKEQLDRVKILYLEVLKAIEKGVCR